MRKCMCLKKQYYRLTWLGTHRITPNHRRFLRRKFLKICLLILSMTPPSAACRFGHRSQCSSPCSCERPKQTRKCTVPPPLWAGPCAAGVSGIPSGTQNKVLINIWAGLCAIGVSGTTSGMDEDKVLINMWKQNLESGEERGLPGWTTTKQDGAAHLPSTTWKPPRERVSLPTPLGGRRAELKGVRLASLALRPSEIERSSKTEATETTTSSADTCQGLQS